MEAQGFEMQALMMKHASDSSAGREGQEDPGAC